jgi:hypothetical protein
MAFKEEGTNRMAKQPKYHLRVLFDEQALKRSSNLNKSLYFERLAYFLFNSPNTRVILLQGINETIRVNDAEIETNS